MKKYIKIFKNRLAVGLEYRANIFSSLILDLISIASVLVLWFAIYKDRTEVAGYTFNDMVLYYMLISVVGSFTQVFTSEELGYEIRLGALSNYLVKPFNLHIDAFCRTIASKMNYILVTFPVYITIIVIFSMSYGFGSISPFSTVLAVFAVMAGFLLHFIFDLCLAWLAFWIGDVWTFKHFKQIVFLIFGGIIAPVEFVSGPLRTLSEFLPFKFMYYVPNAYLLGRRGVEHIVMDLVEVVLWFMVFAVISQILWSNGLKKYEAYGG